MFRSFVKLLLRPEEKLFRDVDGFLNLPQDMKTSCLEPPREVEHPGLQHLGTEGCVFVDVPGLCAFSGVLETLPRTVYWSHGCTKRWTVVVTFVCNCLAELAHDGLRLSGTVAAATTMVRHGHDARSDCEV